jgi:ankyrin repeat protein
MSAWAKRLFSGLGAMALLSHAVPGAGADLRLLNASADRDKPAMRELVKQGVDVNVARPDGVTALLLAAHFNDLDSVDLLLTAKARVNAADDHGVTPLAEACQNANAAMVDKLLTAGANPNAAQSSGLTPLMIATHTGNLPVVKSLLGHGADVNAATAMNITSLMWAVADQRADIAALLIASHARVDVSSKRGDTPLMYAAVNGDIEIAKALIAAGADINQAAADGTHLLPFALLNGKDEFAMFLLDKGADPNGSIDGVRALHIAAGGVDVWLEDWMRTRGANGIYSSGTGGGGRGPVQRAAMVSALLARGADPNARITTSTMMMSYVGFPTKGAFESFACGTGDMRGATPLWVAALAANAGGGGGSFFDPGGAATNRVDGAIAVLKALLAGGADYRLTTDDGTTPLMVAAGLGRSTFSPGLQRGRRSQTAEEAVTLLLDAGADVNAVNEADFTALHGAAFRGLDEVIEILVKRGAHINARDFRGRTAYRIAEGSKQSFQFQAYPETAQFIKKLGADATLGIPGTVQERNRDLNAAAANQ